MQWCELCNGVSESTIECIQCGQEMEDQGRIYDYFDDYSPYMEIDLIKLADGDPISSEQPICVHLFKCRECGFDLQKTITIQ
ncbi:hypothetical protein [Bacillus sp. FJAT-49736]|uniref:hypothetical protein n=1 Tax=Bacillus sp. FJAT-49736 TaxID=2833582 RepID=UPI001BCA0B88|nr:hypothetical protein [Bacillus sp. FJAT-49736]MBS4171869.1 hypothetical protein [Bacillus sp. FJAT-49736]